MAEKSFSGSSFGLLKKRKKRLQAVKAAGRSQILKADCVQF